GCREDTLLVFSFALTVELFPPLRYIVKARLIVCQNLYCLALAEQDVADRRILHCIVLCKIILKCSLSSRCSTFHQLVDVSSAYSDRKQTYCCEHGETSSHVIRHNK